MKRKTKILFLIYLMWTVPSFAQSTYFDKYFATSNVGGDIGYSAIQLSGGNYLTLSSEYDFTNNHPHTLLIKLKPNGDTLWSKLISTDTIGLEGIVMEQMKSNTFIIAGSGQIFATTHSEFFNMSVDSNGNVNWIKYYPDIGIYKDAFVRGMVITKNKEILSVGFADDTFYANYISSYAVKADSNGKLIWAHFYGGPEFTDTRGWTVVETSAGYIIDGASTIHDKFQTYDGYLTGIDTSGNQVWQKLYGTYINSEGFNGITSLHNGYFLLTGEKSGPPPIDSIDSEWLLKIDSIGDSVWQKLYGTPLFGEGTVISSLVTSDNNIAIIGQEPNAKNNELYGFIMKVNQNGDSIWKRDYHYPNEVYNDYFYGFSQTADSGFIIMGNCHPYTQGVWLLKVDQFGCDSVGCTEATGIEPVPLNFSIFIYPNPVHTTFFISYHLPQNTSGEVEVFNLLGQRIYSATLSPWSSIHEIDAGKWANGIYEVKVSSQNQYATLKIVKE